MHPKYLVDMCSPAQRGLMLGRDWQAPAGVVLSSPLALPYAAPYIPPPSLPPPEYPHLAASSTWLPGRKRALLVAANYSHVPDPQAHLRGCATDVHCLRHLLVSKFGCV